jgi:hypothetical protein
VFGVTIPIRPSASKGSLRLSHIKLDGLMCGFLEIVCVYAHIRIDYKDMSACFV